MWWRGHSGHELISIQQGGEEWRGTGWRKESEHRTKSSFSIDFISSWMMLELVQMLKTLSYPRQSLPILPNRRKSAGVYSLSVIHFRR